MYRRLTGRGVLQTTVRGRGEDEVEEPEEIKPNERITFDDILENCYRYLGINDPEKVLDMTPKQYSALMRGYSYKLVDDQYIAHKQAWINNQVSATKSKGKGKTEPVFKTFNKFFDYEREIKRVDDRFKESKVSKKTVNNFRQSVAEAERLLNGGE